MDTLLAQMQTEFCVSTYLHARIAQGDREAARDFFRSKERFDHLKAQWEAGTTPSGAA